MQIKVKTLDKKELVIEIEENDKVEILKKKIQEAKDNDAALEPAISKLIWKGKILNNEQIVKDAGINDKGFCVIMPGKVAKKAEEPKTESSSKKEEEAPKKEESTPATTTTTTSSANPAPNPIPATPPAASSADDLISQMQAQLQISDEMITQIVAISGVEAQKAKLALTVSQGNPDLAVELILSNNLDAAVNELKRRLTGATGGATQQNSSNNNTGSSENTGTSDSVTSGDRQVVNESNPLHYLTQSPMGQQMLAAIRQNPGILPQILQQISQSNPDLFQQLQDNHEAFLQLLEMDGNSQTAPAATTGGSGAQPQQMQGGGQRVELQISQQDREAIDRLMSISQKSEVEVVQAYMACDKNEEHALNLLFDS